MLIKAIGCDTLALTEVNSLITQLIHFYSKDYIFTRANDKIIIAHIQCMM